MNIEYINAIPLCKIFDKLKLKPVQESDLHSLYPSPFQKDKTHTMEVSHEANNWYDSSNQKCGGSLELIIDWLRCQGLHCSIPDAVKWFRLNIGYPSMQDGIVLPDQKQPEVKFAFKYPILNPALIGLITGKGIPLSLARKHLHQVGLTNVETGAEFLALGLKTEEGDWWVHSPYVSTFIGTKSITYIPGSKYSFRAVHIFKDVFDYMAAKMCVNGGKPFEDECIILNSYECLENSGAYIRGFGYETLYSWLGNDPNGQQATKNYALLCSIEDNLRHEPVSF